MYDTIAVLGMPTRDYQWLLGLIRAYWEDVAPVPQALTAYVTSEAVKDGKWDLRQAREGLP